jgi:hypothetical protein
VHTKPCVVLQARVEVGVLQLLNGRADVGDGHHIVRMRDFFVFRAHLCLVFELLSVNLYELIKHNQFRGLSMNLLRLFMTQVAAVNRCGRACLQTSAACKRIHAQVLIN